MNRRELQQFRFDALKDSVERGDIVAQEPPKPQLYDVVVWDCESGRVVSIPFAGLRYEAAHWKLRTMQTRCSRNAKVVPSGSLKIGEKAE